MARILVGKNRPLRRLTERFGFFNDAIWRVEAAFFGLFLMICGRLSPERASAFGHALMRRLGPRQAKHKHVRRNLALAFPDKPANELERLGGEVWGNMGAIFAEYAQLETICRERLEVHVDPAIETFRYPGKRQAVFVSAHFGNWEILAAAISSRSVPITAVYTPINNPYVDRQLAACREHLNCHLLPRDESMRGLIKELQRGRSIGLVMDQRVDSGSPVPFFGIDKLTTLIPARLALRHGAELVVVRCLRDGPGRFRVDFFPPVVPVDPDAPVLEQAEQMSTTVNGYFEAWIRERPGDWFCTKRRWAKDAVAPATAPVTS